jgi:hypothetical protein
MAKRPDIGTRSEKGWQEKEVRAKKQGEEKYEYWDSTASDGR